MSGKYPSLLQNKVKWNKIKMQVFIFCGTIYSNLISHDIYSFDTQTIFELIQISLGQIFLPSFMKIWQ